jgi:hypothetical protein
MGADKAPWWNEVWPCRQRLVIVTPDPKATINTALAVIETDGNSTPDGRDLRIVDKNGAPVKHEVLEAKDGTISAHFAVTPRIDEYYAYYGNPTAPAEKHSWEKRLGGLTLKTARNPGNEYPNGSCPMNWAHMQRQLQAMGKTIGEGPRKLIDDGNNPYATTDAEKDNFIGIYRGKLYCPEGGNYIFATNSDDASFMLIDGKSVVEWAGPHDVSALGWDHTGTLQLERGIHQIDYYLVQWGGGVLARAGWQPPGAKQVVTIPARYFITELRVETVGRERLKEPVNAFFTYTEEQGITFNRSPRIFVPVTFKDRTQSGAGNVALRIWDFGDGTPPCNAESPRHVYTAAGDYRVTLESWSEKGLMDKAVRTVHADELSPERASIFMDVESDSPVLTKEQPLTLQFRFKASALEDLKAVLELSTCDDLGRLLRWSSEEVTVRKDSWTTRSLTLDLPVGQADQSIRLIYMGVTVLERTVRMALASQCRELYDADGKCLSDAQGRVIVMRLGDAAYRPAPLQEKLRKGGALRMVVVDDMLSPTESSDGEKTYAAMLRRSLEKDYPGVHVEVTRIDGSVFEQNPALERLGKTPLMVSEAKPDLVIVAPGMTDILTYVPEQRYELYLSALVERLASLTRATIVLITPPPLMAKPDLSRGYAYATKRVATRLNLPVADAYSAFSVLTGEWHELYRDATLNDEVYYVWPTEKGQRIIAERLAAALVPGDRAASPLDEAVSEPADPGEKPSDW